MRLGPFEGMIIDMAQTEQCILNHDILFFKNSFYFNLIFKVHLPKTAFPTQFYASGSDNLRTKYAICTKF